MLRVAFVLRSTEVQPEFFDLFTLSPISLVRSVKLAGALEDGELRCSLSLDIVAGAMLRIAWPTRA